MQETYQKKELGKLGIHTFKIDFMYNLCRLLKLGRVHELLKIVNTRLSIFSQIWRIYLFLRFDQLLSDSALIWRRIKYPHQYALYELTIPIELK